MTQPKPMIRCGWCGKWFEGLRSSVKFCGDRCRFKARSRVTTTETCANCGEPYQRTAWSPVGRKVLGGFCSPDCYHATRWPEVPRPAPLLTRCRWCRRWFTLTNGRLYCCHECAVAYHVRKQALKRKATTVVRCGWCRTIFSVSYRDKRHRFCSQRCQWRHGNKVHGWANKAMRRAAEQAGERVEWLEVFYQANCYCQLCGLGLEYQHRGTTRPDAPEIDHIVPLALGGTHCYANVQLACRACNHAKGATMSPGRSAVSGFESEKAPPGL